MFVCHLAIHLNRYVQIESSSSKCAVCLLTRVHLFSLRSPKAYFREPRERGVVLINVYYQKTLVCAPIDWLNTHTHTRTLFTRETSNKSFPTESHLNVCLLLLLNRFSHFSFIKHRFWCGGCAFMRRPSSSRSPWNAHTRTRAGGGTQSRKINFRKNDPTLAGACFTLRSVFLSLFPSLFFASRHVPPPVFPFPSSAWVYFLLRCFLGGGAIFFSSARGFFFLSFYRLGEGFSGTTGMPWPYAIIFSSPISLWCVPPARVCVCR